MTHRGPLIVLEYHEEGHYVSMYPTGFMGLRDLRESTEHKCWAQLPGPRVGCRTAAALQRMGFPKGSRGNQHPFIGN